VGAIVLAVAAPVGWQITSCEIANSELQEDLRDVASQNAARLGLTSARTDEDFRNGVVHKAMEHGIRIEPDQVIVERTGTQDAPAVNLRVNYTTSVGLPGFRFSLHFSPRAQGKPLESMRDAR
jgi:hypothetical protein